MSGSTNNYDTHFRPPPDYKKLGNFIINRQFLTSAENTTLDSAIGIMKDKEPSAFQEGVARVRREVERAEKSGNYQTFYSAGRLRVFWGIKK